MSFKADNKYYTHLFLSMEVLSACDALCNELLCTAAAIASLEAAPRIANSLESRPTSFQVELTCLLYKVCFHWLCTVSDLQQSAHVLLCLYLIQSDAFFKDRCLLIFILAMDIARRNCKREVTPKQSWWGSVYCQYDLQCGHSGFVGEDSQLADDSAFDSQALDLDPEAQSLEATGHMLF